MVNKIYERDLTDLSGLKRPGRLDFRIFGTQDNVGDGYPGMQRAIRNYFHLGYNEYDIDLNNKDLKDVKAIDGGGDAITFNDNLNLNGKHIDMNNGNITNIGANGININSLIQAEIDQLANINSVTISNTQWGYLGVLDQNLRTTDNVIFAKATLNAGNLVVGSVQLTNAEWTQLATIDSVTITNTQWGYLGSSNQGIATSDTPSFTGLTLTSNLQLNANSILGTSVNINNAELQQISNIGSATISGTQWGFLGDMNQGVATGNTPSFTGISLTGNLVLAGNSITGTSVDINNAELQQLSNIGGTTISGTQWGYLGNADQGIAKATNPFQAVRLTLTQTTGTAPMTITSTTKVSNLNADTVDGYHVDSLTDGRIVKYNSTGTKIQNTSITESSGALTGITTIGMSGQLTSTLATGTAPFSVASTTKVTNLHADRVDDVNIATLTNGRLLRYNSTGTQIENATVTESSGALGGITSITMSGALSTPTSITMNGALSGATTISMNNQLTNTYNSGAPFVITSTTKVNNLNVDKVDGYDFNQPLQTTSSPVFVGLTLSADLVTTSTIDGVDVSTLSSNFSTHIGNGDIHGDIQYGSYTGDGGAYKSLSTLAGWRFCVIVRTSATQKSWMKIQGMSDITYDSIELSGGTVQTGTIQMGSAGLRAHGELNNNGATYIWYGVQV